MHSNPESNTSPLSNIRLKTCGELDSRYELRIMQTLQRALFVHPRLTVVRFDLRFPDNGVYSTDLMERDSPSFIPNRDEGLIKRFFASLKAQIDAQNNRYRQKGKLPPPTLIDYVWVREFNGSHQEHFHIALMVNKDRFYTLGKFGSEESLAGLIQKAWARALGIALDECTGAVHFPKRCVYHLDHNKTRSEFLTQLAPLLRRLSYLTKKDSKVICANRRSFGCSAPKLSRSD